MSDVPQHVDAVSSAGTEVELSEQQLFQLATGESVTVAIGGQPGPRSVQLTVTPPAPIADSE